MNDPLILPKSPDVQYVDALAEAIQHDPEWLQDDLISLQNERLSLVAMVAQIDAKIASKKAKLASAYALPQNDRRLANPMNGFEFSCRIIDPTCRLRNHKGRFWVVYDKGFTKLCFSTHDAWKEAFTILDRRRETV